MVDWRIRQTLAARMRLLQHPAPQVGRQPGKQLPIKPSGLGAGARVVSNHRISTLPVYSNPGAVAMSQIFSDVGQQTQIRSGLSRAILTGVGDGTQSRRHSPSVSSDVGMGNGSTGPGFRGDALRPSYDGSPQSGSPAAYHAVLATSAGNGNLSASPYSRFGHHKSNSTDSMISIRLHTAQGSHLALTESCEGLWEAQSENGYSE
jgi:mitogen-activated protein kinase kinase kinase